eukprot:1380247-Ditylum_brightwellii.AAC.1
MDHTILLVNAEVVLSSKRRVEQEKKEHTREDKVVAPIMQAIKRIFQDKEATQDNMLLINKETHGRISQLKELCHRILRTNMGNKNFKDKTQISLGATETAMQT